MSSGATSGCVRVNGNRTGDAFRRAARRARGVDDYLKAGLRSKPHQFRGPIYDSDMETRIRIRLGDLEVECTGDDAFIATRVPDLVSDLLRRLRDQPAPTPPPSEPSSPLPRRVSIAGTVINYFNGNPLTAARVSATGLTPSLSGTADASGRYTLAGDSAGAECFLAVTGVQDFVDTATGPFKVAAAPLTLTAFAATATDLNRQYDRRPDAPGRPGRGHRAPAQRVGPTAREGGGC